MKKIMSMEDADKALRDIAEIAARIETEEAIADREVRQVREDLVRRVKPLRERIEELEDALEQWAKSGRSEWPTKSIELNFGIVGFRLPRPTIKCLLAIETIIERLRARKMNSCIRVKEEIDKEALANYSDEEIAAVGCKRKQGRDKFYYEIKREAMR
jgi:phage host-nuclease inhibitor protein Gam